MQGDCRGHPPPELTAAATGLPLLPLRGTQCLLLIDDAFLEARGSAPGSVHVAVSNLYLRVQQFQLLRIPGVVSGNGASVWLSDMTLQGGPSYGAALNAFDRSYFHVSGAMTPHMALC